MTELVGEIDGDWRTYPFQAPPQQFDRIELWRSDAEDDEFNPQVCSSFSSVLAGMRREIVQNR